ncbi:DUF3265 domain-containing protein [Vibrio chagasii]|nr:DUF3265 domain-containing protein [Vibrio chagasii]
MTNCLRLIHGPSRHFYYVLALVLGVSCGSIDIALPALLNRA